jgi:hypothetical protein
MTMLCEVLAADGFCGRYGYNGRGGVKPIRKLTYGAKEGQPRCCGKTYEHGSNFTWTHQCDKAARITLPNGWTFCGVHEPAAVIKRNAASAAKSAARLSQWDREAAARKLEAARKAAYPQLVAALREIAAGHNDPRTLAADLLATLPEEDRA